MNCYEHKPLYGRTKEMAYLQGIVGTVLHSPILDDCDCTLPTESTATTEGGDIGAAHETSHNVHATCDAEKGGCHFVLVSGPQGAGKRTLVANAMRQFRRPEQKSQHIIYVSERFRDARNPDTADHSIKSRGPRRPFQALKAIQEIVRIASNNEAISHSIRQKHKEWSKNSEDASALCELVPGVKQWLQVEGPAAFDSNTTASTDQLPFVPPFVPGELFAVHYQHVWVPILDQLLRVLVSIVPVVFLFEDLHYADESSMVLIQSILHMAEPADSSSKGLLLLATYSDDNGVPSANSVLSFFDHTNDGDTSSFVHSDWNDMAAWDPVVAGPNCFHSRCRNLYQIVLSDLTWDDVSEWVHACGGVIEQCSTAEKCEITDIVFHHSHGNPLCIGYLLQFLEHDETLLQEPIHKKSIPCKMDDLFIESFLRQDELVQKCLQVASLLAQYSEGGDVPHDILEIAMNSFCVDTIELAHWYGLIQCSTTQPSIHFCLESFQKKVYNTIPNMSALSLDIGRKIWSNAIRSQQKKEGLDEIIVGKVLLSTKLLRNCIDLLTDIDERIYMSQLCYDTGQKLSSLGDFYTSASLFDFAICVLGTELWRHNLYEASLELHNAAAQAYCCIGEYVPMQKILDDIFDMALTFQDKLAGYVVLLSSYASQNKLLELLRTATMVLHDLGEPVNTNPGTLTVLAHLHRTKWALRGKSDEFFSNLPFVENTEYFILTQVLSFAMYHSYIIKPNAGLVLCFRLLRLSIKHGLTGPSLHAYTCYAFFLCAIGDVEEGYRIGQLALKFANKSGAWWPRINVLVYGCVNIWTCPFRQSIEPLSCARRASRFYGDLDMNASASFYFLATCFSAGISLRTLKAGALSFCQDLSASRQMTQLFSILPLWSLITGLLGEERTLDLSGDVNDVSSALKHCIKEGNKFMAGNIYAYETIWYYLIGDFDQALQMAKKSYEQRQISDHALTFYEGLAALAESWDSTSCLTRRLLHRGKKSAKRMKRWADRCPDNFRNKQCLLEAEIAALKGKSVQAISLFNQSIAKAKLEAFFHEEAIAYECLGRYQQRLGNDSDAKLSYVNARKAYEKYGASILVDRMNALLNHLPLSKS